MEEHDTIIDKNNKKSIEFERCISKETQKTTYDYNDLFWDSI